MKKPKFRIGQKVFILSSKKTDGRYNKGKIVGIEMRYGYLGFKSEKQFFDDFDEYQYKVAFVDCVTNKGEAQWIHHSDVALAS